MKYVRVHVVSLFSVGSVWETLILHAVVNNGLNGWLKYPKSSQTRYAKPQLNMKKLQIACGW